MSFFKWLKQNVQKIRSKNTRENLNGGSDDDDKRQEEEEITYCYETKLVYFASTTPNQKLIDILNLRYKDVQTFTDENECVECLKSITDKVFLIIDGQPSTNLIETIKPLKQIDSIFFYSPSSEVITAVCEKQHTYIHHFCENVAMLKDTIGKSSEELDRHTAVFNMYNKKEKAMYNLSKGQGSFIYFELFKFLLKNLPKTSNTKQTMIATCRNYYRGNLTELANIDDFDRTYKSSDAISWYTKETFVNEFINKTLRMQDLSLLYLLRFYIMDLSEQLELKFQELKKKQKDILKLYRAVRLSQDEMADYQNSIGNLISNSEYLSASSERSVAYNFVTKFTKQEGVVRALVEYLVDLNVVKKIVIADIRQYSAFPEEAQFIVDIGASFKIDSCEYNAAEDLWHIKLHATDESVGLIDEYIEYQKKKMTESNIVLSIGNLFLEMGEYDKAERYFDVILNTSNPNDEEIVCIFFNFGRTHRLKGDLDRAISCYNRAYYLHMNARPKRAASAGKTLNGLGVIYSERGQQLKAEEYFERAMHLYKKSLPKNHVDVARTLINLGIIDCSRKNFEQALRKYQQAKEIYDSSLPSLHPHRALARVNLGNVHLANGNYQMALEEYEAALKLQQATLPADHRYIARTMHNLAIVHAYQENMDEAKRYLKRAEEIANETFSLQDPIMTLFDNTKDFLVD